MSGIQTGIRLDDQFTRVMHGILNCVSMANSQMAALNASMNQDVDASGWEAIQAEISQATLLVDELAASMDGIDHPIDQNVAAQERFNGVVNESTEGMAGLEGAARKVGAAIGAMFAVQKVVDFIGACTEAANVQNNAESQLATTLSNMGGNERDYDALVEKAQDIQAAGMYGDEALIGAAAEFATYMSDTSAIELMMDTLTNYAAGMSGGGSVDYGEMVNYATNLGKVTTGAYDAMTKKGFEFTDAQKAVIEGTATESQYVEALGAGWQSMSDDMRSATIIADTINESWDGLYATMSDTPEAQLQSMKNSFGDIQEQVGNRLYPALGRLWAEIASNAPQIENILVHAASALEWVIDFLSFIIYLVGGIGDCVQDNWSMISPIIEGIVGALAAYVAYLAITKAATVAATVAQGGLNAAMKACPVFWIFALIAAVIAAASYIAQMGGSAMTTFGAISGGVNVVIQFFRNLGLCVFNVTLGIGNALAAVAGNMVTAFHNAICSVRAWFYGLLADVLTVIEGIAKGLNSLPFVSFDYSGVTAAADDYAAKAAEVTGNKKGYVSISEAFNEGMSAHDAFQDGWISSAYDAGAAWGDEVASALGGVDAPGYETPVSDIFERSGMEGYLGDIASDTHGIKDSLDVTEEDLKYLRDIAEQEAVNRFTTAEIKIEQTNHNNISSDVDLDGVVTGLTDAVSEAVEIVTEGVHD